MSTEIQINPESSQRSEQWFLDRAGKSTSSEFHKLMGAKGLGKTGETYAKVKAREIVDGIDPDDNFESYEMRRGTEMEPFAFRKLKEILEKDFIYAETCDFVKVNKDMGSSPDGKTSDNGVIEIKCPNIDKLKDIIMNGISVVDNSYIYQMQHQMMCTGATHCYFFNYCVFKGSEVYHLIKVDRDEAIIKIMKERQKEFVSLRDGFVELQKANQQY